eukprot:g6849.t1
MGEPANLNPEAQMTMFELDDGAEDERDEVAFHLEDDELCRGLDHPGVPSGDEGGDEADADDEQANRDKSAANKMSFETRGLHDEDAEDRASLAEVGASFGRMDISGNNALGGTPSRAEDRARGGDPEPVGAGNQLTGTPGAGTDVNREWGLSLSRYPGRLTIVEHRDEINALNKATDKLWQDLRRKKHLKRIVADQRRLFKGIDADVYSPKLLKDHKEEKAKREKLIGDDTDSAEEEVQLIVESFALATGFVGLLGRMTNSPAVGSDPRSAADTPYHRMSSSNEPALRPLFDRNVQQGPTQRLIGGPNDGPPRLFGSATWNQIVPGTAGTGNDIINSNNGGNGGPGGGGGGRTGRGAAWNMDQLVQAAIRLMGLNHAMVRDILIQILLLVAGLAFVFTGDLRSAGICLLLYYAWYLYLQLTYGLAQHLLQNGPPPGGAARAARAFSEFASDATNASACANFASWRKRKIETKTRRQEENFWNHLTEPEWFGPSHYQVKQIIRRRINRGARGGYGVLVRSTGNTQWAQCRGLHAKRNGNS